MRRIRAALLLIVLLLFVLSLVAVADNDNKAQAITEPTVVSAVEVKGACTTVWLTFPSYYQEFGPGTKRCLTLNKKTSAGWIKVTNSKGSVLDYVSPHGYTKVVAHNGDGSKTARTIKALGTKYGVKVQFANVDQGGRKGCDPRTFAKSVSGTYSTSPTHYGKGLVRLGTGAKKACISKYPKTNINIAKHEISHGIIERKCKGKTPFREENTTDAYAWKFLKASSRSAGNYGFSDKDLERAVKIHRGVC